MNLMQLFLAVPAGLFTLGTGAANADQTVDMAGAIACVNDKWTESEPEKGHKLADLVPTMRPHPQRSRPTEVHPGLRGKVRVHARQELEGHRDLH
jgi:hypothetical protein